MSRPAVAAAEFSRQAGPAQLPTVAGVAGLWASRLLKAAAGVVAVAVRVEAVPAGSAEVHR